MKTITFGNNRETLITTDVLCGHKASTKNSVTGIQLMEKDEAKCGWDLKCITLYLFFYSLCLCLFVCVHDLNYSFVRVENFVYSWKLVYIHINLCGKLFSFCLFMSA